MKQKYDIWIKEFMESWKELDWERTLKTLDKEIKYYENPIDEPCKNFAEVTNLWNVVADNQKDIEYKYQIIAYSEENCIVNWQMTRVMTKTNTKQEIDGIFQIALNDAGKCTLFKQWRFTR
ncbi:MAG: SnoaL-like domain-containing protein [Bacilli bacterium]|nr:SnoaL-like domain-containing protein [Bacilli bacterium]